MLFVRLLSRLPLWLLYTFSDVMFVAGFYLVRYRRKMIQKNLSLAFPGLTRSERSRIERDFFRNLCDYAVEMLKLVTISEDQLRARMRFTNPELIAEYSKQNQSVLYLASHQFNWEWVLASGCVSLPLPVDFVYQPVNNKFFNHLSLATRSRFGGFGIKRSEVARVSLKRNNILRGIAIVADQYPGYKKDKKYITSFLNQETAFFYGINQLAVMTQYPAVFIHVKKRKRGYYEATLKLIAAPPYKKR
ncbi:MAG: lipid A biosynthesis acyltransferase [Bacteroidia bacterium]|nr:lipid A biosynthesis acyltransferase [Bacteroidia bacterium]